MTDSPRILVVGTGSPNADMVAEVLNANGMQTEWTDKIRFPNPFVLRRFDFVYGIYLQTCSRYIIMAKLLGKKTMIHFVGSDAYWYHRERSYWRRLYWKAVLHATDLIFYVSPHLQDLVKMRGVILPIPIRADEFKRLNLRDIEPDRDILYYCPSGETNEKIYRLSWIIEYARDHPQDKISIIGSQSHPADYRIPLQNVEVIRFVPQAEMSKLYRKHRKLVRMTLEDGLPKMIYEALLSGIEVVHNGDTIKQMPKELDPKEFAESFGRALRNVYDNN
jgi:hypothetical protein